MSANKGVVSLTGFVKSYTDKYEAEAATKRVAGVVGIASLQRIDEELRCVAKTHNMFMLAYVVPIRERQSADGRHRTRVPR